jgi:putative lipoic acid-binding regulatory protein
VSDEAPSDGAPVRPAGFEFPCVHPLTLIGRQSEEFRQRVRAVLDRQPSLQPSALAERLSRDGTYLSLACEVHVDSREQLDALYRELHATGHVLFAL